MSLILPDGFPVVEDLCNEGIARELLCGKVENTSRALRILIVNLMPVKRDAERDFLRLLAHSPYDMIVDFLRMKSHISKNTPMKHVETFYKDFDRIAADEYDGMILTGAPVEHLPFEQVDYWMELCQVMDWATNHVRSTLCVCWGAQAALYHYYGINKHAFTDKMFGVFPHTLRVPDTEIVWGFDDVFFIPHSRYTEVRADEIECVKDLQIVATSDMAGVYMVEDKLRKRVFVTGHAEYARNTLHNEYQRDLAKGLHIHIPYNYYPSDDATQKPLMRWRSCANLLIGNWLNYYVASR